MVVDEMTSVYRKRNLRKEYVLNFEELYFLTESLLSYTETDIEYFDPYGRAPLTALLSIKEELVPYSHVEYSRALGKISRRITDIIDQYDTHFRQYPQSEQWYRIFWQGEDESKFDIFTFNYDTTIEQSIGDYEDGFELIENNPDGIYAFNPSKLLQNTKDLSTIQHLHGCIYYSGCKPIECDKTHSNWDMFKTKCLQDALNLSIGYYQGNKTQDREFYYNSPILVGLRKLDKMTFMPSSIYHANLVRTLMQNRGLLIVGYSFGDLYVNKLLQRRLLMAGDDHRLIIIDAFPKYVNSALSLRSYMYDKMGKMLNFLEPFLRFSFDDNFKVQGVDFTSYYDPIYSEDRKCMLFICGFKQAVERHSDLILNFL